jgi:hypothetical protein
MVKTVRTLCVLLVPVSAVLLPGCGSRDPAPFRSGDFFEYRQPGKDYGSRYQVEGIDEKTLRVVWRIGSSPPVELIIDGAGEIVETPTYPEGSLGRDLFHGRQLNLWLPTEKKKVGEQVYFCDFLARSDVSGEKKWKEWDVWVTRHSNVFGWQENYYDKETGFLVGSRDSGGDIRILTDSSVERLKRE